MFVGEGGVGALHSQRGSVGQTEQWRYKCRRPRRSYSVGRLATLGEAETLQVEQFQE